MGKVRDLAEKLWTEKTTTVDVNPLAMFQGLEEVSETLAFVSAFGNVTAVSTRDGLVVIDTGGHIAAAQIRSELRRWSDARVHTVVYTHGHVDHVMGIHALEKEAADNGWERPRVIAHDAVVERFDRYSLTSGYNAAINARQFRVAASFWPTEYRYPDETFSKAYTLEVGDVRLELFHDRGETDDHVWAWWPDQRALCTGDLFIWASPNCGNPQKAQRYPREWAAALRKMAALEPEMLFPGHGPPIFGADRVRQALEETAALLSSLVEQVLELMNQGARLDDVIHTVTFPEDLLARPYLRPVYDEPAFIVRNLWRLYGGWYDGNPARLKPAPDRDVAKEVAKMAGGAAELARRAVELADAGDLPLACHLIEWAWQADPDATGVAKAREQVYGRRAGTETSLMARSIYSAAASASTGAK